MDDPRAREFKNILDELVESEARSVIIDLMPWLQSILPEKLVNWIIKMDIIDLTKEKFLAYFKVWQVVSTSNEIYRKCAVKYTDIHFCLIRMFIVWGDYK